MDGLPRNSGPSIQFSRTGVLMHILRVLKPQGPKDRVPARSESEMLPFGWQRIAILLAFPAV